ncbi:unnamed protein product [Linum tenue]|uniref:Alpha/beta hydrolase fold-3 domain-containing protein n=1 Tax=Linum tenue TaxID=586396 RepID=A0AAV0RE85_9ROSI|nr:unnamed protein product [Linum tenue]
MGADSRFYDIFCRSLASETPAVVVSVNYRLAPEHRCPSQYEDGFDAVKFLDAVINLDGVDLGRCFLAGDSAGGNLAHHVAVRAAESEAALKRVKVTGLISIQPFFGGEERTESDRAGMFTGSLLLLLKNKGGKKKKAAILIAAGKEEEAETVPCRRDGVVLKQ